MSLARKGVTPVAAILILVLVTISLSLVFWVYTTQYVDVISGCVDLVSVDRNIVTLRNCGTPVIPTFDLYIADVKVPVFETNKTLMPRETKRFTATFLPLEGIQTVRIVTPVGITSSGWPIARSWIVEVDGITGAGNQLKIDGHAYLNNKQKTPYISKKINYRLDLAEDENITTDSQGKFTLFKSWSFSTLQPGSWWLVENNFTKPVQKAMIEPPGRVLWTPSPPQQQPIPNIPYPYLLFNDTTSLIAFKEVSPVAITDTHMTYRLDYTLDSTPLPAPAANERVIYHGVFDDRKLGSQYIDDITCFGSPVCRRGSVLLFPTSTLNGIDVPPGSDITFDVDVVNPSPYTSGDALVQISVDLFLDPTPTNSYAPPIPTNKIMDYVHPEVKLVEDDDGTGQRLVKQTFRLTIPYNSLVANLNQRFPGQPVQGTYLAGVYIHHPNASSYATTYFTAITYRFSVGVGSPPIPNCPDLTNSNALNCVFYSQPWSVMWELQQPSGQYRFGFDARLNRGPADLEWTGLKEEIFYVDRTTGDVTRRVPGSSGMRQPTMHEAITTTLPVPQLLQSGTQLVAFSYGVPLALTAPSINVESRTYILNTGKTSISTTDPTPLDVFTTRGDMKTCVTDKLASAPGGILDCDLDDDPNALPTETVQNWLLMTGVGSDIILHYTTPNAPEATCTLQLSSFSCPYASLGNCEGNFCRFERSCNNGNGDYCDETATKRASTTPTKTVAQLRLDPNTLNSGTKADITIWNWYLNNVILWSSAQTHVVSFTTAEPYPFLPGTIIYNPWTK